MMTTPIVSSKLYIPAPRANAASRPRLLERFERARFRSVRIDQGSGSAFL
ncbi:hypothetical protein [Paenibacillus antri]|nr:hypothetical protein [Paenibacillus antri]